MWDLFLHNAESQGPVVLELNIFWKICIFTEHPSVTIEAINIQPKHQNLTRYDWKQVQATENGQIAAG